MLQMINKSEDDLKHVGDQFTNETETKIIPSIRRKMKWCFKVIIQLVFVPQSAYLSALEVRMKSAKHTFVFQKISREHRLLKITTTYYSALVQRVHVTNALVELLCAWRHLCGNIQTLQPQIWWFGIWREKYKEKKKWKKKRNSGLDVVKRVSKAASLQSFDESN